MFVSGRITEAQLDDQRKFITKRLENVRAKLDDYRAWAASGAEKLWLMGAVFAWARDVGQGLDELTPEQRKEILQMVVEEVIVNRNDNVDITLAIPIDGDSPEPESVAIVSKELLRLDSGLPSIEFPSAPALSSLFREVVSYSPSCRHKDRLEFDQPSAATTYSGVTVARRLGSGLLLRVPGAVCKGLVSLGPEL